MTTTEADPLADTVTSAKAAAPVSTVLGAWSLFSMGRIGWAEFVATVQACLEAARARIGVAADIAIARRLGLAPVGHIVRDLADRDAASLVTVTSDEDAAEARLERFLQATCGEYCTDALLDAMRVHGIAHWRWNTAGSDDCDECSALDGQIFSIEEFFDQPHMGCDCFPSPEEGLDND